MKPKTAEQMRDEINRVLRGQKVGDAYRALETSLVTILGSIGESPDGALAFLYRMLPGVEGSLRKNWQLLQASRGQAAGQPLPSFHVAPDKPDTNGSTELATAINTTICEFHKPNLINAREVTIACGIVLSLYIGAVEDREKRRELLDLIHKGLELFAGDAPKGTAQ